MARCDGEWVQDIISAIADIRADTVGLDLAAFAARQTIPRSRLDIQIFPGIQCRRVPFLP